MNRWNWKSDSGYITFVKKTFYFLILSAFASCNITKSSSFDPNSKYSPAELRRDFSILNKVLKANHPSLYWYSTEDSVNNAFAKTYDSLNDSLTQQQCQR